ncbi:hypothetical protein [Staphylococcus sp. LKG3-3]|uniref:hypothetical protein n=1 Tax=Staphylococcus sp. LKG3-3 TaxID=3399685 RepID=UPI003D59260D
MLVNYNELIWVRDTKGKELGHPDIEVIAVYQIPNLAIYLHIDTETHKVLTVEFDIHDQPELLEKDIPRNDALHVYQWLQNEGYIYGQL